MEKTIRMPKELLAKWLAALRSGEVDGKPVTQASQVLHNGNGGYCCLGVLQKVAAGRVQRDGDTELPPMSWLRRRGVEFRSSCDGKASSPWLPGLEASASMANDDGFTFAEIADAIEACAEGY